MERTTHDLENDELVEVYQDVKILAINNCNTIFGFKSEGYPACQNIDHLKNLIDQKILKEKDERIN